jgi:hypothetical protein
MGAISALLALALGVPAPRQANAQAPTPTPPPDLIARGGERLAAQIAKIDPRAELIFGPAAGLILGDTPEARSVPEGTPTLQDFLIGVSFAKPETLSEGTWNYAIFFRSIESAEFAVQITSEGTWRHLLIRDGRERTLKRGDIPVFRLNLNQVIVHVKGRVGALYINDKLVAALDVSGQQAEGSFSFGTLRVPGQTPTRGDVTRYALSVYAIQPSSRVARPDREQSEAASDSSDSGDGAESGRASGGCTVLTRNSVNLRAAPATNARRLGVIPAQATLRVDGQSADGDWLRVTFRDVSGWVRSNTVLGLQDCGELPVVEG